MPVGIEVVLYLGTHNAEQSASKENSCLGGTFGDCSTCHGAQGAKRQRGNQMCHCLMMITRTSKEKHIHYHTQDTCRHTHTQGLIM